MKHNLTPVGDATKGWGDFVAHLGMSGTAIDPERRQQMIQTAAYYRAEKRGFDGGDPSLDWIEAEREIDRMMQSNAGMHDYLVHLDARLKRWDEQFQDIKGKAGKTRTKFGKQLETLASLRATIDDDLQKLRRQSGGAWADLKESIDKIWDEMRLATEKITSHFKDENITSSDKRGR